MQNVYLFIYILLRFILSSTYVRNTTTTTTTTTTKVVLYLLFVDDIT